MDVGGSLGPQHAEAGSLIECRSAVLEARDVGVHDDGRREE